MNRYQHKMAHAEQQVLDLVFGRLRLSHNEIANLLVRMLTCTLLHGADEAAFEARLRSAFAEAKAYAANVFSPPSLPVRH
jgi:hypothetical protein